MVTRVSIIVAFILSGCLMFAATQGPGERTRSGQNLYNTQEAHDAVQDEQIKELKADRTLGNAKLDDVTDKQNYTLGGIAVLSVLFTANAIVLHRKKP